MKYRLLDQDSVMRDGIKLQRVLYEDGDLGPYIEAVYNLSDDSIKICRDVCISRTAFVKITGGRIANSYISNYAFVKGSPVIIGSTIKDSARVEGDASVFNTTVKESWWLREGVFNQKKPDVIDIMRCSIGIAPINGKVILYKRVQQNLSSFFDPNFKYEIGKKVEADADPDTLVGSGSGLHFSSCGYWDSEIDLSSSVLLAAEILEEDIICCQLGKVRVRACTPIGVVKRKQSR